MYTYADVKVMSIFIQQLTDNFSLTNKFTQLQNCSMLAFHDIYWYEIPFEKVKYSINKIKQSWWHIKTEFRYIC